MSEFLLAVKLAEQMAKLAMEALGRRHAVDSPYIMDGRVYKQFLEAVNSLGI